MRFGEFIKFHRKSGGMGHPEIGGREKGRNPHFIPMGQQSWGATLK
jgi:hypothetical protein